ncbi:MAG: site-2 protease family protein [Betaproteobacteria bacterium]|nr:site-2 protease family protein [Burkholderiales bacterium]MBT5950138.1 site-2 protease family protein [Betaproteobacteria bacterium]MBL6878734.1 site-2 protease family protein [Burkholderiales bacterium]MBT6412023.1 site-2 protease family protein [Betaproteobacteria bacterium]MCH1424774.1 site-2 protease family protein [Burkholderiales bacterium]
MGYWIQLLSLYAIPAVLAITLHEAAHGYAAKRLGDLTAYQEGRITLNPIKHIDLIGTLVVPAVLLLATGGKIAFGWAKPVPVNFSALRNPKRDMLWVAAAGPGANLAMAIGWALLFKLALTAPENYFSSPLLEMSKGGILINLVLMVLNLIPVPPLDGGRIAISALPHAMAYNLAKLEPYGLLIIMLLMASGVLSSFMYPILGSIIGMLSFVFGI